LIQINYQKYKLVKHGSMLSPQALFALTYVPAVPLIAISIVAGMNKKPQAQKWYGFFGIIFFVIAVVAYVFFLIELVSY